MATRKKASETPAQALKRAQQQEERERWERWLLRDIRAAHLPEPERNYRWHETREYRSEFVYPDPREMLIIEVDGGLNVGRRNRKQQARDAQEEALAALAGVTIKRPPRGGGHASPDGYERDRVRDAEALCLGYRVLRVTPGMVERGEAVAYIERVLRMIWQGNGKKAA
jgi:very-short-patch-repair endonuclease